MANCSNCATAASSSASTTQMVSKSNPHSVCLGLSWANCVALSCDQGMPLLCLYIGCFFPGASGIISDVPTASLEVDNQARVLETIEDDIQRCFSIRGPAMPLCRKFRDWSTMVGEYVGRSLEIPLRKALCLSAVELRPIHITHAVGISSMTSG